MSFLFLSGVGSATAAYIVSGFTGYFNKILMRIPLLSCISIYRAGFKTSPLFLGGIMTELEKSIVEKLSNGICKFNLCISSLEDAGVIIEPEFMDGAAWGIYHEMATALADILINNLNLDPQLEESFYTRLSGLQSENLESFIHCFCNICGGETMSIKEMLEVFENWSYEIVIIDEDLDELIFQGPINGIPKDYGDLIVFSWDIKDRKVIIKV